MRLLFWSLVLMLPAALRAKPATTRGKTVSFSSIFQVSNFGILLLLLQLFGQILDNPRAQLALFSKKIFHFSAFRALQRKIFSACFGYWAIGQAPMSKNTVQCRIRNLLLKSSLNDNDMEHSDMTGPEKKSKSFSEQKIDASQSARSLEPWELLAKFYLLTDYLVKISMVIRKLNTKRHKLASQGP